MHPLPCHSADFFVNTLLNLNFIFGPKLLTCAWDSFLAYVSCFVTAVDLTPFNIAVTIVVLNADSPQDSQYRFYVSTSCCLPSSSPLIRRRQHQRPRLHQNLSVAFGTPRFESFRHFQVLLGASILEIPSTSPVWSLPHYLPYAQFTASNLDAPLQFSVRGFSSNHLRRKILICLQFMSPGTQYQDLTTQECDSESFCCSLDSRLVFAAPARKVTFKLYFKTVG
ncbi:hypothetical protein C8R43DRAFT_1137201 [Mycena crocata]|nr:hypothetical protein C8R43DRAFT_1137201 [Mycena crocata]